MTDSYRYWVVGHDTNQLPMQTWTRRQFLDETMCWHVFTLSDLQYILHLAVPMVPAPVVPNGNDCPDSEMPWLTLNHSLI